MSGINQYQTRSNPRPRARQSQQNTQIQQDLPFTNYNGIYGNNGVNNSSSSLSGYYSYSNNNVGEAYQYDLTYQPSNQPSSNKTWNSNSRQYLDVRRLPLKDAEADGIRPMPRTSSSISNDADVESIASGTTQTSVLSTSSGMSSDTSSRYRELPHRPVAAPRTIRQMYGEKHPRLLRPEELPSAAESSGDETDVSRPRSLSTPTPRPRTSSRATRSSTVIFIEEDLISSNKRVYSILKPSGSSTSLGKTVRFEHVDKGTVRRIDATDYSDVDSRPGKHSKSKADIWGHVKPVSTEKKKESRRRSPSRRQSSRPRSSSWTSQSSSTTPNSSAYKSSSQTVQMPAVSRHNTSGYKNYRESRSDETCCHDREKCCKWSLIIGIPTLLLIIVVIVVIVVVTGSN